MEVIVWISCIEYKFLVGIRDRSFLESGMSSVVIWYSYIFWVENEEEWLG